MTFIKKLAVVASVACGTVGIGASLVPGTASAAPSSALAGYNGGCGARYSVIDKFGVNDGDTGTVYLTWNNSNGYHCVVTVRDHPGSRRFMGASVRASGGTWVSTTSYYTTYAGPVYAYTRGHCVDWGGGIDTIYHKFNSHCTK